MVILVGAIILVFDLLSSELVKKIISRDEISITDLLEATEHDHDHDHADENSIDENTQTPIDENSEPTIDNNTVTE